MGETRKLAAIMVVDVVGYSRLMGEDEAGTARAVKEHRDAERPIVAGLGGRIVKTMGDGLLLEFPSVVAAVECAVVIQKLMAECNVEKPEDKRIVYRIGVNVGDVLIEGDDILGDGVNIAARLEGVAEPGGICISGSAYEQVRGRIEADFVDLGEKALKNIARPVRTYAIRVNGRDAAPTLSVSEVEPGPPRLSIVVLPFANLGGDPEQDYFVDGVTESLTTDLSRMSDLIVIAHSTAITFKGKGVDLKQIGRELNVRYVLEGSIQRSGARMRVNVQLIDAESRVHLWAERFEEPVADFFDMQDEIVSQLAAQLDTELTFAEARRSERAANPDAMDLCFQSLAAVYHGWSPELLAKAREFAQRALALDPGSIQASYIHASVDTLAATTFLVDDRAARLASAEKRLTKVLALEPGHARAHTILGVIQASTSRPLLAIAGCERALALDRNLAGANSVLGYAKTLVDRAEETEAHVRQALRLSPRDRSAFHWFSLVAAAKLHLGAYDEAVVWSRRSIAANRNFAMGHFRLAAALSLTSQGDEARASIASGLALEPTFTIRRVRAGRPSGHSVYAANYERFIEALRAAGAPEG